MLLAANVYICMRSYTLTQDKGQETAAARIFGTRRKPLDHHWADLCALTSVEECTLSMCWIFGGCWSMVAVFSVCTHMSIRTQRIVELLSSRMAGIAGAILCAQHTV